MLLSLHITLLHFCPVAIESKFCDFFFLFTHQLTYMSLFLHVCRQWLQKLLQVTMIYVNVIPLYLLDLVLGPALDAN